MEGTKNRTVNVAMEIKPKFSQNAKQQTHENIETMTNMKDGGWTAHLKTIHIAKEPEYKVRKK